MSERTDSEFATDIEEAIRRISSYTAGLTYEAFLLDTKTQDATVRNLEIIGEAAKVSRTDCVQNTLRFHGRVWPVFEIG